METNMGTTDRILRFAVAITLIGLYAADIITGTWAIVALALAGVFILTSFISFCPLYLPFGIRTNHFSKHSN